jgi:hypothetical protein
MKTLNDWIEKFYRREFEKMIEGMNAVETIRTTMKHYLTDCGDMFKYTSIDGRTCIEPIADNGHMTPNEFIKFKLNEILPKSYSIDKLYDMYESELSTQERWDVFWVAHLRNRFELRINRGEDLPMEPLDFIDDMSYQFYLSRKAEFQGTEEEWNYYSGACQFIPE